MVDRTYVAPNPVRTPRPNAPPTRVPLTRGPRPRALRRPRLKEEKEERKKAAARISAHFKGRQTRALVTVIKGEKQFSDAKTKSGYLEKRSAKRSFFFGSRQIVLWQRRFARIDDFHFCYSARAPKVRAPAPRPSALRGRAVATCCTKSILTRLLCLLCRVRVLRVWRRCRAQRRGDDSKRKERRIHLSTISDILTVEGMDEFILVTADGQFHFHCLSAVENQSWINTISLLQAFLREQRRREDEAEREPADRGRLVLGQRTTREPAKVKSVTIEKGH
jgi:hypothetical protein